MRDKETARVVCTEKGLEVLPNHEAEDEDMPDAADWQDSEDDDDMAAALD